MALNLEQTHSKNEILEAYLNTVAFAPSVYGAQAASQYFFGKNAADLDLNEAAILAGMVNNPNLYNPFTESGPPRVEERRSLVLDAMARDGYISKAVADETKGLPLTATRHAKPNGCIAADNASTNGYFCQYVLDYLENLPEGGGFILRGPDRRRLHHPHHPRPRGDADDRRCGDREREPGDPGHRPDRRRDGRRGAVDQPGRDRSAGARAGRQPAVRARRRSRARRSTGWPPRSRRWAPGRRSRCSPRRPRWRRASAPTR